MQEPKTRIPAAADRARKGVALLLAAGLLAALPTGPRAQPYQDVSTASYINWENYGQSACLARASRAMAAAQSAFGLQNRFAGAAGAAEAIDAGDTHALIYCAPDLERDARTLVMIGVHTTRPELDVPLRDFLQGCMTTSACSAQAAVGAAPRPQAGRAQRPEPARPRQRPGVSIAAPGSIASPPPAAGQAPAIAGRQRPRRDPAAPPTQSPAASSGIPSAVSLGPVSSMGSFSIPPPGPPASASLPWPRPDSALLAARQRAQQPAATQSPPPAAAAQSGAAMSAFCRFTSGPFAGRTADYSGYPGVTGAAIGSPCADGAGSAGVVVAPTADAERVLPPGQPLPGGQAVAISTVCQFTSGPMAGRVVDYAGYYPGFTGAAVGTSCGDSAGSFGVVVAPTASAERAVGEQATRDARRAARRQARADARAAAPAPGGQGGAGVDLGYLAQRFGALRATLSLEPFANLYADLSVLLGSYGRQVGWVDGMDGNAPPGDPGRGISSRPDHYNHVINGGAPNVAAYVAGRLTDLGQRLPAQYSAELARQVDALLRGAGR